MNILIAGAGMVGFRLAKALSSKHSVILVDKNESALEKIQENIDVLTVPGNVEDPNSYKAIEDKNIDIFIAVTDTDETNLVSSIIVSEKINVKQKIIRLRKKFFAKSSIADKIGITDTVFPYILTAQSIVSLLKYPQANNVKNFAGTDNKLISIKIDNDIDDLSVSKIDSELVKVVGVDSGKKLYIPNGDEKLNKGDMVYLFGNDEEIKKISNHLNNPALKKIKNIVIFGANILGIEIAKALQECDTKIKIIEKDLAKCEEASEVFKNNVTIINSKYGEFRLYEDEGLKNADMIIAASINNDEENIIKCIEAKEQGVAKVVAINNDIEYYNLMHSLGVVVVRGPKINAFYSVMEIIGSNHIVTEKLFCGGSGIFFIREFKGVNTVLDPLNISGAISIIVTDGKIENFNTKTVIDSDAIVITFSLKENEAEVRNWINNL